MGKGKKDTWFRWGFNTELKWIEPEPYSRARVREWMKPKYLPARLKVFALTFLSTGFMSFLVLPKEAEQYLWMLVLYAAIGLLAAYGTAIWMWFMPTRVVFGGTAITMPLTNCASKQFKWEDIKHVTLAVANVDGHVYRTLRLVSKEKNIKTEAAMPDRVDLDRVIELFEEHLVTVRDAEPVAVEQPA